MTGTLPVAEIIDRTYQGEGPSRCQVATFVRLGGCNLACEWCDQPETWDGSRFDLRATITTRDVADVLGQVHRADAPLLVITGGEPLLYQRTSGFRALVAEAGRRVEIETNGTITPAAWLNRQVTLNVSPKLAHAGGDRARRIRPASLTALAHWARIGRARWKFVVRDLADLDQVDALVHAHAAPPASVWLMPEGTDIDTVLDRGRVLADAALDRGYNLTLRDHVLLWPGQGGR